MKICQVLYSNLTERVSDGGLEWCSNLMNNLGAIRVLYILHCRNKYQTTVSTRYNISFKTNLISYSEQIQQSNKRCIIAIKMDIKQNRKEK